MISFVGAGPGAEDLITLRGAARLAEADIVVWASSLVPKAVVSHARPEAELHDSATMTLEDVLALYGQNPDRRIVRLHSGDPSLYGALQEQIAWCERQGRPFEIVPGVSAFSAAAAALGRELTLPGVSQSVILTRMASRTAASVPASESVAALAAAGATMAVFLSAARPAALQEELLAPPSAYGPQTPAAVVFKASWPEEHIEVTTLGSLAETIESMGQTKTVLVLVGEALAESSFGRSHLYDPSFAHAFRRRSLPGSDRGRPARRRRGGA